MNIVSHANILRHVIILVAVRAVGQLKIGLANAEEVRPQTAHAVLGDVEGDLRHQSAKQEEDGVLDDVVEEWRDDHTTAATVQGVRVQVVLVLTLAVRVDDELCE